MPTLQQAILKHANRFAVVLRELADAFDRGESIVVRGRTEVDGLWSQIELAQVWSKNSAVTSDDAAHVCSKLGEAGGNLYLVRVPPLERVRWFKACKAAAARVGDMRAAARHSINLAIALAQLGHMDEAVQYHSEGIEAASRLNDARLVAMGNHNLGEIFRDTIGRTRDALRCYRRALRIGRRIGDLLLLVGATFAIGGVYREMKSFRRARFFYEKSLRTSETLKNERAKMVALNGLALLSRDLGELTRARDLLERVLAVASKNEDRVLESLALGNLAPVYGQMGDRERAIALLRRQADLAKQTGLLQSEANASYNLSLQLAALSRYRDAIDAGRKAKEIYSILKHPLSVTADANVRAWSGLI